MILIDTQQSVLWSSLEIVKLIISISTPIIIVLIGFWINQRLKRLEHLQWTRQKLIDKRIQIFDLLIPKINDVYCYFIRVGSWKDFSPIQIISFKRDIDKIAHVNAALFEDGFLVKYEHLMKCFYDTFRGKGTDSKILADPDEYRKYYSEEGEWNVEWDNLFDTNKAINRADVKKSYAAFLKYFSNQIGITASSPRSSG